MTLSSIVTTHSGTSRRDFVRAGVALGAGSLLLPRLAAAQTGAPMVAGQGRTLTVSTWGGTAADGIKQVVAPELRKLTGADVVVDIGAQGPRYNKLMAQRNSPSIDVFFGTDELTASGHRQGLLQSCERSRITRYAEVDPRLLSLKQLDTATTLPGAPYTVISYALTYSPETVKKAPTSWLDLWSPEYADKLAYFSVVHSMMPGNIALMAELLGGSAANPEPAFTKLKTLRPSKLTNFWTDWAPLQKTGDVILATENDAYTATMKAQGYAVDFVVPKEGSLAALNYVSLVKGTKNADLGQVFIDLMIDARVQEQLAVLGYAGTTNRTAKVPAELAAKITTGAKIDKLRLMDPLVAMNNRAAWTEKLNTEVIPMWSAR